MKIQTDKSFILAVFLILLVFAGSLLISVLLVRNRLDISQSKQNNYLPLLAGQVISQKFTAKHDFLNIITVNLNNPGLINRDEYIFALKSEKGETLFEQTFNGFNIGDPGQVRFQFSPIRDSQDKRYILQIVSKGFSSLGVVNVPIAEGSVEGFDSFLINNSSFDGVLTFSAYYRADNKINALKTIMVQFTDKASSDLVFISFWFLSIIILFILNVK